MIEGTNELRDFIRQMEADIARVGGPPVTSHKEFLAFQQSQMERLVALEDQFRAEVIAYRRGERRFGYEAYKAFVRYVQDTSILSARPFFRERQEVFSEHISDALRSGDVDTVTRFRVNYRFVRFIMARKQVRSWPKRFHNLAKGIMQLRDEAHALLMPLALSRVRIFWSSTPKSHLTFMDMLQLASEGVMAAIDKYVLPFSKNFRAVVIGRISGNLIEAYSETQIHFYPNDRRTIYRANKAVGRMIGGMDGIDYDQLADQVHKDTEGAVKTTSGELSNLLSAASCVSSDGGPVGLKREVSRLVAPEEASPEYQVEQAEAYKAMHEAAKGLTLLEKKFLVLRGILEPEEVYGGAGG